MDHPRSKLPAVLAILFCIALLGGVGVLLWKTLPEKQQPQQAETIQTDSVFSSEQTAVEPEREAPYEGELPEQAEAAQPEQPDSEQPSEPAADPAAPDDTPVTDAQKTAQATLASMTEDEKLWQLFFVTPEAITNVNTATVAGEATKNALAQYPVGGIVYFAKNLEDRAQAAVQALAAGCDMILMPSDLQGAFDAVKAAVADGTLTQSRIDESVLRILTVKAEYGILQ